MEQYYELKKQVPDLLLLFRMGDFYEVFFEDAEKTARLLNITLTHRGKLGETPIPMAGIPHHAASTYIDRLTGLGEKVAICEQIQDPKEAKGIVKRGITQIVSPAMPYDFEKVDQTRAHYMLAGHFDPTSQSYALIALDYTTGEFFGSLHQSLEDFKERLHSLAPTEWITWLGQWDNHPSLLELIRELPVVTTHLSQEFFELKHSSSYLNKLIPGFAKDKTLQENPATLPALGAMAYYVCSTQDQESYRHFQAFRLRSDHQVMRASQGTLMGLEILPRHREVYRSSLLGFFDRTQTALGARCLKQLFQKPLVQADQITQRQDFLQALLESPSLLETIRTELTQVRDLERILGKMATGKATPTDLLQLAHAITIFQTLEKLLTKFPTGMLKKLKPSEHKKLGELARKVQSTLNDELGASLEKGNLIRPGFHKQRDKLAKLAYHAADELLQLEGRYREETGITKLRVKSNNVNGYFIEVSKGQTDKVPKQFQRRQTLTNCERYITEELAEFEKEIFIAKDKLERLERELFKELIDNGLDNASSIQNVAQYLAMLDALASLAFVAQQENLTRPRFVDSGRYFQVTGMWHPLIRSNLKDQFVTHDLLLDDKAFFGLITGPNMAGKTTVMREVAIVQHLAQVGSFVPAHQATLSLADYLFSRLGASDDILKGQSTFMVEMTETAEILRHASARSLIILDEVGRGTSTYDGLSIAWALVEHLIHQTRARTLFATHYHELIEVIDALPQAKNFTVETLNQNGEVRFLYRLIEQAASQSFGLYVAKLAGLPPSLLKRAAGLLKDFEHHQFSLKETPPAFNLSGNQLSFLSDEQEKTPSLPPALTGLLDELEGLDVMNTTPLEALSKLEQLKQNAKQSRLQ